MTLADEIINKLSSAGIGGTTSTASWRLVQRDFIPGTAGSSTQAQQICVTPTGGFPQVIAEDLGRPTFQVRIRGDADSSTGLEDKVDDVVGTLNRLGPYLPTGTLYQCTDANAAGDSALTKLVAPNTGTFTLSFDVRKGTSTQSAVRFYRGVDASNIINATITWTGNVPTVTPSTGTLVSVTHRGDDVYRVVLTGTVAVADAHVVFVTIANAVPNTSTGTVFFGNWTVSSGTLSSVMTGWSVVASATVALATTRSYLDVFMQGDTLFLGRDDNQRPVYAVNFLALRSQTT